MRDENEFQTIAKTMLVHFFSASPPNPCIYDLKMIGFAEELVSVNYTDKIVDLMKTVSETCLQIRKNIAKRALSSGGNAVIAYSQDVIYEFRSSK